ncbi:hypothetical protein M9H77_09454 [Catharanthus roseus]|uniref:Uncharacterized protein n=1 Tax=Catharanthus roseus TaxID=4058 RepID=A0ACC0C0V5_CATRO|nr:hypothetical protein M9H77_09454 [Catharanthus roseus]
MKDAQNNNQSQLFPKLNPTNSAPIHASIAAAHNQPSFVFGSSVVGNDRSPFVFGANNGSSSRVAFPKTITQTQNVQETTQAFLWDPNNVSRKKRSTLDQRVLSPTERLHQKLVIAMEDQSDDDNGDVDPESVLIFERINKYIPENEIGLGCMLLKLPSFPTKDSKPKPNK